MVLQQVALLLDQANVKSVLNDEFYAKDHKIEGIFVQVIKIIFEFTLGLVNRKPPYLSVGAFLFYKVGIPVARRFDDAFLVFKIYVNQAETWSVSFGPFKIIHKGPYKIAPYIYAFAFCTQYLC